VANKKFTGDLSEYNENYIRCRGIRNHTWQFETDFNVATNARGRIMEFTRTLHCAACTTNRLDTYEVTKSGKFRFKSRKYDYADGYQVHRGNPIDSEAARDALLMREMRASLDVELMTRLLNMRPDVQNQPLLKVVGG
jgi:hypothetical protein